MPHPHEPGTRHAARSIRSARGARSRRDGRGVQGARHQAGSAGRRQGPVACHGGVGRRARSVRTRGPRDFPALASPCVRALRRRPRRRHVRISSWSCSTARRCRRSSPEARSRCRKSLRIGGEIAEALAAAAQGRHRPSRSQARQRDVDALGRQAARLRTGQDARARRVGAPPNCRRRRTLTAPGMWLGTAPYMAPEQFDGRPVDGRSDVFALGAVLYEMATGRRAFAGETTAGIASSILRVDPPAPSSIRPGGSRTVRSPRS